MYICYLLVACAGLRRHALKPTNPLSPAPPPFRRTALLLGLFASPDVAFESGADFTGVFYIKRYKQLQDWQRMQPDIDPEKGILFKGDKNAGAIQLGLQVIGIVVVAAYSGVMTYIFLKIIDLVMGLRVNISEEVEGLDASVHGEKVYYGGDEGDEKKPAESA